MSEGENNFIGWDIGGAHLKMVETDSQGKVIQAVQYATPIWQGLDTLVSSLTSSRNSLSADNYLHALTITGELSDIFEDRKEGVEALLSTFDSVYTDTSTVVYCGKSGFLSAAEAIRKYAQAASANWHATASYLALKKEKFILADIGSTTTDLILVNENRVISEAYTDQERMREGSLVYTGFTRTPVMAVVDKVNFEGSWQSIAAEYFATMADVYRVTGELKEEQDLMPAADGGDKSRKASIRRLARMLGTDVSEHESQEKYLALAQFIAEQQLKTIQKNLEQLLYDYQQDLALPLIIVGAGSGRWLARKLAKTKSCSYCDIESFFTGEETHFSRTGDCAAAFAVAQLARANLCH